MLPEAEGCNCRGSTHCQEPGSGFAPNAKMSKMHNKNMTSLQN